MKTEQEETEKLPIEEQEELPEQQEETAETITEALKLTELQGKYLLLYSDFENYRRRTAKERIDLISMANKDLILSLLPVLDDFDRANEQLEKTQDFAAVSEGLKLIYNKLQLFAKNVGLEALNSTGLPFDPEVHDAITKIKAPEENLKGKVVNEVEKAYKLHDKIIRHAKVVVGE